MGEKLLFFFGASLVILTGIFLPGLRFQQRQYYPDQNRSHRGAIAARFNLINVIAYFIQLRVSVYYLISYL
jgi:hypothetical protein